MKARILAIAFLASASLASAQQIDSSLHVNQFPGLTVAAKITSAMNSCPPSTGVPCVLVLDPSLANVTSGAIPTLCSTCYLVDWRSGPPYTASGSVNAIVGSGTPSSSLCLTAASLGNFYLDFATGDIWKCGSGELGPQWSEVGTLPQFATGVIEAKAWGAVCDGEHDDTAALAAAAASMPMIGGIIHIPSRCTSSAPLALPDGVPGTVYGDGGCNNDFTQCVSELLLTGSNMNGIVGTGQYLNVHGLAVVSAAGLAGTAQTAGALIDYCDPSSSYDDHVDLHDFQTEGGYIGVQDCNSEAGQIGPALIGDSYFDGVFLGTGGSPTNLGDTHIGGLTLTGAGDASNAAIDSEGAAGGFVDGINIDQGITPQNASFDIGIKTGVGGFYTISHVHGEHYNDYCMYLLVGASSVDSSDCDRPSDGTANPDIYSASSVGEIFHGNYFQNGTGSTLPQAILFAGSNANQDTVVSADNVVRGYAAVQTGLAIGSVYGNYDEAYRTNATPFGASGCSYTSKTGDAHSGTITLGANSCSILVTFPEPVAANGWSCSVHDVTSDAYGVPIGQANYNGTGTFFVIPGTAGTADSINFSCDPM